MELLGLLLIVFISNIVYRIFNPKKKKKHISIYKYRDILLDRERKRLDAEYEKEHENTFVDTDILDSDGKPVKRKWDKNKDKRPTLKF